MKMLLCIFNNLHLTICNNYSLNVCILSFGSMKSHLLDTLNNLYNWDIKLSISVDLMQE